MIRRTLCAVFAAAMLMSFSVGVASASATTLTGAIRAQDTIINGSPAAKTIKHLKVTNAAEARKGITACRKLVRLINRGAATVARVSATAAQKTGQRDWVSGNRTAARAINQIAVELADLIKGDKPAAKAALKRAEALQSSAAVIEGRGDRLLGLPTSA